MEPNDAAEIGGPVQGSAFFYLIEGASGRLRGLTAYTATARLREAFAAEETSRRAPLAWFRPPHE